MNILLLGYGKMGKVIEGIAKERNHNIVAAIDQGDVATLDKLDTRQIDAAIEFTQPDAAVQNIRWCIDHQIPVLSGTTGWLDQKPEVDEYCRQNSGSFFYAANFSIGVNLFFHLNKYLADIMKNFANYRVEASETHHTEKKDAPSGTALHLVNDIIRANPALKNWVLTGQQETIEQQTIPVQAYREANVPGTHTIKYSSEIDEITITHQAYSRKGFALGAVMVAEWIPDKSGVLSMDDYLVL